MWYIKHFTVQLFEANKRKVKFCCSHFRKKCILENLVHRNHFFRLYQREKASYSKVKFRQASNRCKRVLEAAKFAYGNKTKSPLLPRNLALVTCGELLIVLSTKVNLLFLTKSKPRFNRDKPCKLISN